MAAQRLAEFVCFLRRTGNLIPGELEQPHHLQRGLMMQVSEAYALWSCLQHLTSVSSAGTIGREEVVILNGLVELYRDLLLTVRGTGHGPKEKDAAAAFKKMALAYNRLALRVMQGEQSISVEKTPAGNDFRDALFPLWNALSRWLNLPLDVLQAQRRELQAAWQVKIFPILHDYWNSSEVEVEIGEAWNQAYLGVLRVSWLRVLSGQIIYPARCWVPVFHYPLSEVSWLDLVRLIELCDRIKRFTRADLLSPEEIAFWQGPGAKILNQALHHAAVTEPETYDNKDRFVLTSVLRLPDEQAWIDLKTTVTELLARAVGMTRTRLTAYLSAEAAIKKMPLAGMVGHA